MDRKTQFLLKIHDQTSAEDYAIKVNTTKPVKNIWKLLSRVHWIWGSNTVYIVRIVPAFYIFSRLIIWPI